MNTNNKTLTILFFSILALTSSRYIFSAASSSASKKHRIEEVGASASESKRGKAAYENPIDVALALAIQKADVDTVKKILRTHDWSNINSYRLEVEDDNPAELVVSNSEDIDLAQREDIVLTPFFHFAVINTCKNNISHERYAILRLLLNAGCSVHITDDFARTPLHFIADYLQDLSKESTSTVIQFLIDNNANLGALDASSRTPLIAMSKNPSCNSEYLTPLLQNSTAHLNHQDMRGRTALHYRVIDPFVEAVEIEAFLTEETFDINLKDNHNKTALDLLLWSPERENSFEEAGNPVLRKVLRLFADHKKLRSKNEQYCLAAIHLYQTPHLDDAQQQEYLDFAAYFMNRLPDYDKNRVLASLVLDTTLTTEEKNSRIKHAITCGAHLKLAYKILLDQPDLNAVKPGLVLISNLADNLKDDASCLDKFGVNTPLMEAVIAGNIPSVQALLTSCPQALTSGNSRGETPLQRAYAQGDSAMVGYLKSQGASSSYVIDNQDNSIINYCPAAAVAAVRQVEADHRRAVAAEVNAVLGMVNRFQAELADRIAKSAE